MSKSLRTTATTPTFYRPVGAAREIRTGFLLKSPPKRLMTERSWKNRYFVLFKVNDKEHHLKYFRSPEDMEKPLGEIDLTQVSLLRVSPLNHHKWSWIQRNFRCSASCVLYIRSGDRDYFLIGETCEDVDRWFSDLFDALKNRPHRIHTSEQSISKPLSRSTSVCTALKSPKARSMSDPSSNTLDTETPQDDDGVRRRGSAPLQPHYVYPRAFSREIVPTFIFMTHLVFLTNLRCDVFLLLISRQVAERGEAEVKESLYETMTGVTNAAGDSDREVEEANLMKTVTDVFDRMRKTISPLPSFIQERADDDRQDKHQSSEFSSSSSENGATSPLETLDPRRTLRLDSTGSDAAPPVERDIEVKQADLKKHLTLTEVDGRPSVCGWTGQQHGSCLFHKGDQILAINDLHTGTLEDVSLYLSKSLKNQVKVTILRLPGCPPLHQGGCCCSDSL